jgi:hypothetical protein
MTVLTYAYCSMKLKILRITDFVLPMGAAAAALPVFFGLESLIHVHVAVVGTLLAYGAAIAHFGPRFFGAFPGRKTAGNGGVS